MIINLTDVLIVDSANAHKWHVVFILDDEFGLIVFVFLSKTSMIIFHVLVCDFCCTAASGAVQQSGTRINWYVNECSLEVLN